MKRTNIFATVTAMTLASCNFSEVSAGLFRPKVDQAVVNEFLAFIGPTGQQDAAIAVKTIQAYIAQLTSLMNSIQALNKSGCYIPTDYLKRLIDEASQNLKVFQLTAKKDVAGLQKVTIPDNPSESPVDDLRSTYKVLLDSSSKKFIPTWPKTYIKLRKEVDSNDPAIRAIGYAYRFLGKLNVVHKQLLLPNWWLGSANFNGSSAAYDPQNGVQGNPGMRGTQSPYGNSGRLVDGDDPADRHHNGESSSNGGPAGRNQLHRSGMHRTQSQSDVSDYSNSDFYSDYFDNQDSSSGSSQSPYGNRDRSDGSDHYSSAGGHRQNGESTAYGSQQRPGSPTGSSSSLFSGSRFQDHAARYSGTSQNPQDRSISELDGQRPQDQSSRTNVADNAKDALAKVRGIVTRLGVQGEPNSHW